MILIVVLLVFCYLRLFPIINTPPMGPREVGNDVVEPLVRYNLDPSPFLDFGMPWSLAQKTLSLMQLTSCSHSMRSRWIPARTEIKHQVD